MSLSGITTIEKVKFKVTAAEKEYFVDRVVVKAKPEGKTYTLANRSIVTKIAGYRLNIEVFSEDVQQDSGTTEDFIALQAEIEDSTTSVYFYPDASQAKNFEVVNGNLKERTILETDFNTRIDPDLIMCQSKGLASKSDIEWFIKF